jgi:transposase-like protein
VPFWCPRPGVRLDPSCATADPIPLADRRGHLMPSATHGPFTPPSQRPARIGSRALAINQLRASPESLQSLRQCPHCLGSRVHRWGSKCGVARFRCLVCTRTYSETTGTFVYRLRRLDALAAILEAMANSESIRRTAQLAGISRGTAFSWRHRVLRFSLRPAREHRIEKEGAFFMTKWFGFRRNPKETIHNFNGGGRCNHYRGVWIAGGWSAMPGRFGSPLQIAALLGPSTFPNPTAVRSLLDRLTHPGARLEVRGLGAPQIRSIHSRRTPWRSNGNDLPSASIRLGEQTAMLRAASHLEVEIRSLRMWIRRFRGVSRTNLEHYLLWFRLVQRPLDKRRGAAPRRSSSRNEGAARLWTIRLMLAELSAPAAD